MKLSKKKLDRLIVIGFIIYMILSIIINIVTAFHEENITIEVLKNYSTPQLIEMFSIFIISCILGTIINNSFIIILFIGIRIATKKYYKQKLDVNDLKKYEGYYRDLIKNYNIECLSYIDDFKIDYESICIAKLLDLKNRDIIEINNDEIKIINEPTNETDKLFINSIKNNKVTISEYDYKKQIIKESINEELLELPKSNKSFTKKILIALATIFFLPPILFSIIFSMLNSSNGDPNSLFLILLIIIVLGFMTIIPISIIFIITYITRQANNPYVRTQKGIEINEKLEGLKNYLNDFGNINEKTSNDLVLWEDYLIYSVMFNKNSKIIDEYKKLLLSHNVQ